MGPFEMVVAIVLITAIAGIFKSRHRAHHGRGDADQAVESAETIRLRDEVKALKERLAVIERITVEKESSLEREIERLRDH